MTSTDDRTEAPKITGADVKRICDTTCKDTSEGRDHSSACFAARSEWLRGATARIEKMQRDVRNAGRRIKRTLRKMS